MVRYVFAGGDDDIDIQLPAEIAEAVSTAQLPRAYEESKRWLAKCESRDIEEVAGWADKMAALATLARLHEDEELEKMARRIRNRCYRKMGEILSEFDARTFASPSRAETAEKAGISKYQLVTASRIAAIPKDVFEAEVESPDPPGTSVLRKIGQINQPRSEKVSPLTSEHLAKMAWRHHAASIVNALLVIESCASRVSVGEILDFLGEEPNRLLGENQHSRLEKVQRGLNFAARINSMLAKKPCGKPTLKPVK